MNPETTVLVDYANENLQLKLRVATLEAKVKELEQTQGEPETQPAAE